SARIFPIEPVITVTHDTIKENVIPDKGLDINLSTSFTLTGFGATFVQTRSLLKDDPIIIGLNVSTDHDWADASITNSPAVLKINEPGTTWHSNVQVTVTEQAPAFTLGKVTVTAKSNSIPGLVFIIGEKIERFEVPFEVGYYPLLKTKLEDGASYEVAPYNLTKIPITIKNLGNGDTNVTLNIIEEPENWNVSLPHSVIIKAFEGEEQVFLEVLTDHDFEEETIKIQTMPTYSGRPDVQGQAEGITLTIINDGSYIEPSEETFQIDGTIIAIVLLVIILTVVGILFFMKKIKK
ncbi:MAG: hypothetical protein QCI00_06480, partial [Candidatus Thermoplasmatota archaeon]|nr:hypothetical protein [Candidatus Thermoplasmatota archaeon]